MAGHLFHVGRIWRHEALRLVKGKTDIKELLRLREPLQRKLAQRPFDSVKQATTSLTHRE